MRHGALDAEAGPRRRETRPRQRSRHARDVGSPPGDLARDRRGGELDPRRTRADTAAMRPSARGRARTTVRRAGAKDSAKPPL
ncbi:hypothetical protein Acsp04_66660 [Actinomadura sp. NBRC 104425]|nr:hypothetical protein Acsp04_66660 [Actinomadura sp. NBRC 104425]